MVALVKHWKCQCFMLQSQSGLFPLTSSALTGLNRALKMSSATRSSHDDKPRIIWSTQRPRRADRGSHSGTEAIEKCSFFVLVHIKAGNYIPTSQLGLSRLTLRWLKKTTLGKPHLTSATLSPSRAVVDGWKDATCQKQSWIKHSTQGFYFKSIIGIKEFLEWTVWLVFASRLLSPDFLHTLETWKASERARSSA